MFLLLFQAREQVVVTAENQINELKRNRYEKSLHQNNKDTPTLVVEMNIYRLTLR